MPALVRRPLAALLLVLALPASAGELIRYRTAGGDVGFVDDERRLPAGVEVLSRTPLEPPRPAAEAAPSAGDDAAVEPASPPPATGPVTPEGDAATAAGDDAAPGGDTESAAAGAPAGPEDCAALPDLLARTRCWRERAVHCEHLGLAARCTPAEIARAEEWCARGEALRAEQPELDAARARARERAGACRDEDPFADGCDGEELAEAERAARAWELRMEALEEQCHAEGCFPGWVRERCLFDPAS
jgi:hypothetical protein